MWFRNIFRRPPEEQAPAGYEKAAGLSDLMLPPGVYRQLDRLRLRASRHLRGRGIGQRPSLRRRPASDFRDHRKYVPGDDVRYVDWKASARSEQVFLKQGEQPQETSVHLLIDTSASMAWGQPPKQKAALMIAAAIGYLALSNEDRLNIAPLQNQSVLQIKGKAQFPALIKTLRGLEFGGQADLARSLRDFSKSQRGGVVLILSDLLDLQDLPAALSAFPRPTWEATLIHLLHPQELAPEIQGEFEMVDSESGAHINYDITPKALESYRKHLAKWREAVELACIEHHVFYTLVSTGWSLDGEIIPHLRRVNVLEPI